MFEADVAKLFSNESERSRAVEYFKNAAPSLIAASIKVKIDPQTLAMSIAIESGEPMIIQAGDMGRSVLWDLLPGVIGDAAFALAALNVMLKCELIRRQTPYPIVADYNDLW